MHSEMLMEPVSYKPSADNYISESWWLLWPLHGVMSKRQPSSHPLALTFFPPPLPHSRGLGKGDTDVLFESNHSNIFSIFTSWIYLPPLSVKRSFFEQHWEQHSLWCKHKYLESWHMSIYKTTVGSPLRSVTSNNGLWPTIRHKFHPVN